MRGNRGQVPARTRFATERTLPLFALPALALLLTLACLALPSAGLAQECVNVSSGEPADCGDVGAVSQEVYAQHNPGAGQSSREPSSDSSGSSVWIVAVVVLLGAGAVAGFFALRSRRGPASVASQLPPMEGKGRAMPADERETSETKIMPGGASPAPPGTPPGRRGLRERIEESPLAFAALAFVLGLLIAGGIGFAVASSKDSDISDLQADLAAEQDARGSAESERDAAQARADQITERRDQIISDARSKAESLTDDAKKQLSDLEDKIDSAQSDLSATESKLSDVQGQLDSAQETKQKSSFGDGIWQADADFLPGLYRAPGGGGCYWAKLNSADTNDIADNGFGGKNPTITIDSPFFETDGCGTWEKIG